MQEIDSNLNCDKQFARSIAKILSKNNNTHLGWVVIWNNEEKSNLWKSEIYPIEDVIFVPIPVMTSQHSFGSICIKERPVPQDLMQSSFRSR